MSFTPLLAVGTLVFTFVNFLTYIRSKNLNGVVTQIIAWAAGILAIVLAAHTQFASQISFGTEKLSQMGWPTQLFIGLIATSILSTVNEVKKAIDNSDSAAKVPLLTGAALGLGAAGGNSHGTVDLVAGAVTVAHPAATDNSRVLVTAQDNQLVGNLRVTVPRPGSFTITSTNPADAGPVAYQILAP
jgi:hypothetical protein